MNIDSSWNNLKWICIWFAVVFGALSVVAAIVVAVKNRKQFGRLVRAWFGAVVVLAAVVGVYALALTCREMVVEGTFTPILFYPIGATLLWAVLGAGVLLALRFIAPHRVRVVGFVWAIVFGIGLVVTVVLLARYYTDVIRDSGYYENVSTWALSIGAVVLVAVLAVMAVFCGRRTEKNENTRSVVYAGICVALSFALSYVTFFKMPQGGSITLASMLPLLIYSYRFGVRRGIIAGLVYGLLQAVQDPWIIHPAQFLLDYPLAFSMLGLAGWLRVIAPKANGMVSFVVGGVTAIVLRYFAHVISGIFAFSSYAAPGYGAVAWGFLYNTFELADGAICLTFGVLLFINKAVRRFVFGDGAPMRVDHAADVVPTPTDANAASTEGADTASEDATAGMTKPNRD